MSLSNLDFQTFPGLRNFTIFILFPWFSSPGTGPERFLVKFYAGCTDPGVERTVFAPNLRFLFLFEYPGILIP